MKRIGGYYFILAGVLWLASCREKRPEAGSASPGAVQVPPFNADSAYLFVKKQVDYGPRVPNTPAHQKAGDYFIKEFKKSGAQVTVQSFEATTFDGLRLNLKNIVASFNVEYPKRILLAAHWDTRPFADKDTVKRDAPFDGANDGASGVGVLLEIARVLKKTKPTVGVDILLFDGEDWGEKVNASGRVPLPADLEEWWCLGSQHWSKNKHRPNYTAYYGVLLDMVGAEDARFYREGVSLEYAPKILDKVWNAAEGLGYAKIFVKQNAGAIIDDHRFVNQLAKIPMINIVHLDPQNGFFGDFHHTTNDNMGLISRNTLEAVGKTLLFVIFNEE